MSELKAPPGPWYWEAKVSPSSDGRKGTPHARLMTAGRPGGYVVLCFERMGMSGAQPVFLDGNMLQPYSAFVENVNHNGYGKLTHPDAMLLAAAPDLYAALLRIQEDHGPCEYGSGKRRPEDDNVMHVPESCRGCLVDKTLAKARGET